MSALHLPQDRRWVWIAGPTTVGLYPIALFLVSLHKGGVQLRQIGPIGFEYQPHRIVVQIGVSAQARDQVEAAAIGHGWSVGRRRGDSWGDRVDFGTAKDAPIPMVCDHLGVPGRPGHEPGNEYDCPKCCPGDCMVHGREPGPLATEAKP